MTPAPPIVHGCEVQHRIELRLLPAARLSQPPTQLTLRRMCCLALGLLQTEFLVAVNKKYGTLDEVLQEPELISMLAPTMKADFKAVEDYEFVASAG